MIPNREDLIKKWTKQCVEEHRDVDDCVESLSMIDATDEEIRQARKDLEKSIEEHIEEHGDNKIHDREQKIENNIEALKRGVSYSQIESALREHEDVTDDIIDNFMSDLRNEVRERFKNEKERSPVDRQIDRCNVDKWGYIIRR